MMVSMGQSKRNSSVPDQVGAQYGQMAIEPRQEVSNWVKDNAGAIAGTVALLMVVGVMFVVMLMGFVIVFATVLLVASRFDEAECRVWLRSWQIFYCSAEARRQR